MKRTPILSFSLRFTLIAQFVLCALLPLFVLSVFFISSFRAIQIEQQVEKLQAIANNILVETQFTTEKAELALEQIARDKNIALAGQSGLFGYSAANALHEYVVQHQFVTAAMLLDPNHQIIEASPVDALLTPTDNLSLWLELTAPEPISQIAIAHHYQLELAEFLRSISSTSTSSQVTGHMFILSVPLFLSETESIDSRSTYTGKLVAFVLADDLINMLRNADIGLNLDHVSLDDVTLYTQVDATAEDVIATQSQLRVGRSELVINATFSQLEELALSKVDALTAQFVFYAGLIGFLFVLLGILFVRMELSPLDRLNSMVKAFHKGDFSRGEVPLPFVEFQNVQSLLNEMGESINQHQHKLEEKVAVRTEALENALSEVKTINRELIRTQNQLVESEKMSQIGVLVAGVAHEVNTPVGVCVTATSILQDRLNILKQAYEEQTLSRKVMSDFIENADNCMEILHKNTERAAELILSFKAVSVDQSSERRRAIHVQEYIVLVLRSLQKELQRNEVAVEVTGDIEKTVETFPGAFSQILSNLILNAIKHGFAKQQNEPRQISIHVEITDESLLDLTFKDNGAGVAPEALPKLFEPFYTTSRQTGGSGLGLSIVYNLATQRLGGKINCYSEPNSGLTIFVEFPVKIVHSEAQKRV